MVKSVILVAAAEVGVAASLLILITNLGVFDHVYTNTSLDHYSERPFWLPILPSVAHPLNAAVNFGYLIVGFCWLLRISRSLSQRQISRDMGYCAAVFAWMSIVYAPTQLGRILTLGQRWAVLDQWFTLPFFMWACVWTIHTFIQPPPPAYVRMWLMTTSLAMYSLSLVTSIGFDIVFGFHMITVIVCGLGLLIHFFSWRLFTAYLLLNLSTLGFVFLKIFDHELAGVHEIFQIITGHFLSKICDFLQIHFALDSFFTIELQCAKKKLH